MPTILASQDRTLSGNLTPIGGAMHLTGVDDNHVPCCIVQARREGLTFMERFSRRSKTRLVWLSSRWTIATTDTELTTLVENETETTTSGFRVHVWFKGVP